MGNALRVRARNAPVQLASGRLLLLQLGLGLGERSLGACERALVGGRTLPGRDRQTTGSADASEHVHVWRGRHHGPLPAVRDRP